MRVFSNIVAIGALAAGTLVTAQSPATEAAASVLTATREALGGEKKLTAVKTLVATGRTRQIRGDNLVPIEFEIALELPDRYVRKDEIPAQESGPTLTGFNGEELIQFPAPAMPPARAGGPPGPTAEQLEAGRKARLASAKQDFARLTLGMFAGSVSSLPLTFTYVAKAEAPQGKADVLDVKGPGNFSARFFVNADTHLPIMVTWIAPAPQRGGPQRGAPPPGSPSRGETPSPAGPPPAVAGQPPSRGEPPPPAMPPPALAGRAETAAAGQAPRARGAAPPGAPGQAPAGPPESRIYYGDYRDVGGLKFPFRLRRALGPDTVEETTFDGFKINPKIDPKKFEVRK